MMIMSALIVISCSGGDDNLDNLWISWLELKEMSDNLCLMLKDE